MKSKSIKYAFLALMAVLSLAACRKEFEEITELDLTRCLVPMELEAKVANGDQVTFSWKVTKDAEKYVLEISEDEEFKLTEDKILAASEVPYTTQLAVDMTYYWRVKATSSKLDDSKWATPEADKASFDTYPVRSDLNPVVVSREKTAVSISWDNAEDKDDLTSVQVAPVVLRDGDAPVLVALTSADINACAKKVEGLQAGREYKFTLLFGKAGARGSVTACTRPDMGEGVVTVSTPAEFLNAVDKAAAPVRVMVAFSEDPYDIKAAFPDPAAQFVTVSSDLYLYGNTTEAGKKPVLSGASFKLATGAKVLHLEDITLEGAAVETVIENETAALTALELVNCEIYDYAKALYVVASGKTTSACETFLVEGCYMHDINPIGKSGGDFIDVRDGSVGDVIIRNSTFYALARSFLRLTNDALANTVLLENNTFNYVTATPSSSNNRGIFSVSVTTKATSVKAIKNVFLNEVNEAEGSKEAKDCWIRLCRSSNDSFRPDCEGNIFYNVGAGFLYSTGLPVTYKDGDDKPTNGSVFEPLAMNKGLLLSEDPCVNSEAGKLYLKGKAGATIVENKAGDPRWWNAVQPVVVRETELKPVTGDFTWDFTEKTIYDTEEITVPTIIGNARIFALPSVPAQVVMSEGVSFSQGAVLSGGVPQYSGVGILTTGYGSVKVVAEGVDATVEVVAGGDRYPVLADGVEHTVVLGDLAGENDIYVIADKELTLKKISWTTSLTPEATMKAIAKPVVTVTPAKLEVETAEDVVVSWGAVTNAADYVYTWQGVETITAETSFTIPAAEVAALAEGEYAITVKARPVPTSTKWLESEVASAILTIEPHPTAGAEITLSWDYTDYKTDLEAAGTINTAINPWTFSVGDPALTWYSPEKSKYNKTGDVYYIQSGATTTLNADGTPKNDYLKFVAPMDGHLVVTASGTNTNSRSVYVFSGGAQQKATEACTSTTRKEYEFDVKAGDVYIYGADGGLRWYKVSFTYVDQPEHYLWNYTDYKTDLEAAGTINTAITPWTFSVGDPALTWYSPEKSKYNKTGNVYYIQSGATTTLNADGTPKNDYLKFSCRKDGHLVVTASGTNTNSRSVYVYSGGAQQKAAEACTSTTRKEYEFDVKAGDVYIYGADGGLRWYEVKFDSN